MKDKFTDPILEKYDKLLEQYNNLFMPMYLGMMNSESKPFKKLYKGLFDFYKFTNYLLDNNFIPRDEQNETIRLLYASASKSFFGIIVLLEHGVPLNAVVNTRQLLETMLYIKYILNDDTEKRINVFNNFIFRSRWLAIERDKKMLKDSIITKEEFEDKYSDELIKQSKKDYDDVKEDYAGNSWFKKLLKQDGYGNGSIEDLADHLGYKLDYDRIYRLFSNMVHGNTIALSMVDKTSAPTFKKENIEGVSFIALGYMSEIVKIIVNNYSGNKLKNEIEIYCDAYCVSLDQNWEK